MELGENIGFAIRPEAGAEADAVWWQHCVDVCNALEAYHPKRYLEAPRELKSFYADFAALAEELAPKPGGDRGPLALVFGKWRAHVTEVEATNGRRLEVLADVLRRLRDMRDRAEDARQVDDLTRTVMGFIYANYRTVPPENAKLRLWCQRAMRRYDLLPKEWREL